MIERDLKSLHAAHGKTCHRAMLAIGAVLKVESTYGMRAWVMSSSKADTISCIARSASGEPKGFRPGPARAGRRGARTHRP